MKHFFALLIVFFTTTTAFGSTHALVEKTVEYKDGDTVLEGFLVIPSRAAKGKPAVIVVHEWMGLEDYAKSRARQLAQLGYVAFAADIYGRGVRATNADEAGKLATKYRAEEGRLAMRGRIQAAVDFVKAQPQVDSKRVAMMGYCFGGSVSLEAARMGAPLVGVISFHGGLGSPTAKNTKDVKPQVLVLHGADDANVPDEEVKAFQDEMKKGNADWEFVSYSGAVHGFTNPKNGDRAPGKGVAYQKRADQRSWIAMKDFFDEIFKK